MPGTPSLDQIVVQFICTSTLKNSLDDTHVLAEAPAGGDFTPATALTSGTTANQANKLLQNRDSSINSGTSVTVNLNASAGFFVGALTGTDLLGNTVTLVEVVALLIRNQGPGDLLIGGEGSADAWSSPFNGSTSAKVLLKAGGMFEIFAPTDPAYAVGTTDNRKLKLEASGGNVIYDIIVLGRTA